LNRISVEHGEQDGSLEFDCKTRAAGETAQVRFTNGKGAFEAPIGTPLEELRGALIRSLAHIAGGVINGKLSELTHDCGRLQRGTDRRLQPRWECASIGAR